MNNKKCRGSLAIKPGRTGNFELGPLDGDLTVQSCSDRVLIGSVHAGSNGAGGPGRGAAAELAGGVLPRWGIAGVRVFWGYRAPFGPGFGRGGSVWNA